MRLLAPSLRVAPCFHSSTRWYFDGRSGKSDASGVRTSFFISKVLSLLLALFGVAFCLGSAFCLGVSYRWLLFLRVLHFPPGASFGGSLGFCGFGPAFAWIGVLCLWILATPFAPSFSVVDLQLVALCASHLVQSLRLGGSRRFRFSAPLEAQGLP